MPYGNIGSGNGLLLTAPSTYLNQCWPTISKHGKGQWQSLQGNFTIYIYIYHQSITKISLNITYLKFHSDPPEANELTCMIYYRPEEIGLHNYYNNAEFFSFSFFRKVIFINRDFYFPKFQDIIRLKFWKFWAFPNCRTMSVYIDMNFLFLWYRWSQNQNVQLQNLTPQKQA